MKLTDNLPRWIDWPIRIIFYVFVLFILFNLAHGIVIGRLTNNAMECSAMSAANQDAIKNAQATITCLKNKNGFFENLSLRPIERAINAMPNHPNEYTGIWNSSQPGCNYQFTLLGNGRFTAAPLNCNISSEDFTGNWGIYENQMVWLYDNQTRWPFDINPMDVVDRDFFLLTEQNGARTRFTRSAGLATVQPSTDSINAVAIGGSESSAGAGRAATQSPASTPGDVPVQWSEDDMNNAQKSLEQERFAAIEIQNGNELPQYVPRERLGAVANILQTRGCDTDHMSVLHKANKRNLVIIASGCDLPIRPTAPTVLEFPRAISISDYGVREIDLSSHGFMSQSGRIEAISDLNNNGRVEFWLSGSICECDGDQGEACDCDGTVVVEEPEAMISAPSSSQGP